MCSSNWIIIPLLKQFDTVCKIIKKVRLSRTRAKEVHKAGAYRGFYSMKQLRVLLIPTGWDASPSQGYRQQYVAGTQLYNWVERKNVR